MKVLVIGSKGFIGFSVYNFFKQNNYEVFGCDVITDYVDKNYFQIDATNADYHHLFEKNNITICINCSGAASVPLSIEFPLKDFSLNTLNVFKILEAIRIYQPKCRFINLSSAAVYGNPESLPVKEDSVLRPLSPYGIHKMHAEQICKEYYEYYQIPTCFVRIFSAYGNGLKKQLLWDLYKKFTLDKTVELYGTGDETRDFIHVDDVVNAIHLIIHNAAFEGEAINLANGEEYSIRFIAELYKANLHSNQSIEFNNIIKIGDPLNWKADISILKSMGYSSTMSIEQGIKNYISWVKALN